MKFHILTYLLRNKGFFLRMCHALLLSARPKILSILDKIYHYYHAKRFGQREALYQLVNGVSGNFDVIIFNLWLYI